MSHQFERILRFLYCLAGVNFVTIKSNQNYKLYQRTLGIILVPLAIWCLHGKINHVYPAFNNASAILDTATVLSMTLFTTSNIILTTFFHSTDIKQIMEKFDKAESFLNIAKSKRIPHLITLNKHKFCIVHAILIIIYTYDYFANQHSLPPNTYKYNSFILISSYIIILIVIQVNIIAKRIDNYFKKMNKSFDQFIEKQQIDIKRLVGFVKCHKHLSEIIYTVSDVYGFQLLVLDSIITIFLVQTTYFWLVTFPKTEADSMGNPLMSFPMITAIWTSFNLVCHLLLSIPCGSASNQGKYTVKLCHKYLKLSPYHTNSQSNMIVQEFSKHICQFKPEFSAIGFFTIELTSLFRILSSVLTYVILLIQFES